MACMGVTEAWPPSVLWWGRWLGSGLMTFPSLMQGGRICRATSANIGEGDASTLFALLWPGKSSVLQVRKESANGCRRFLAVSPGAPVGDVLAAPGKGPRFDARMCRDAIVMRPL